MTWIHTQISSLLKARVQSLSSGPPGSQPRVLALYTLDMKQSQHWSAQQVPWTMCFPISQQVRAVFPTWHRVFLFAAALLTSGKHILQVFASIHVSTSFYSHFRLYFELYTSLYLYILYIFINVFFIHIHNSLCTHSSKLFCFSPSKMTGRFLHHSPRDGRRRLKEWHKPPLPP